MARKLSLYFIASLSTLNPADSYTYTDKIKKKMGKTIFSNTITAMDPFSCQLATHLAPCSPQKNIRMPITSGDAETLRDYLMVENFFKKSFTQERLALYYKIINMLPQNILCQSTSVLVVGPAHPLLAMVYEKTSYKPLTTIRTTELGGVRIQYKGCVMEQKEAIVLPV